ncbi:hypothetical protein KIN20_032706 [Parelaphostrongylus tenuis]|uniref:Peptidase M12A domain-containing protein n=1 Tax=Parelaphostrongylus tenuis TaxID=148309 RepID=A0AAD5R771_PARTN|nr:hypothetical protein KIN20_032706 [Parelaphostrongylus tenuis]
MELLQKLHAMQNEIEEQYHKMPSADEMKAMEDYAKSYRSHMGVSAAEINEDAKIGNSLFEGDMMLTRQQADEILEDIEENLGHRSKRQAFRDDRSMNLQSGKIWLQDDWHDQFNKESERTNYNYNITYDYGTVMHYGATGLVNL